MGHVGTYDGGGYVHNLGNTLAQTQTIIHDLKSKSWVDLQTRAVVLEFAIYSPGTDVTALSAMLVEFPLTGGVITSYEIQSQKLLWFQENRVDPLMICEVRALDVFFSSRAFRHIGELIVQASVHCLAVIHTLQISSQKPQGQSKPDFIWSLHGLRE